MKAQRPGAESHSATSAEQPRQRVGVVFSVLALVIFLASLDHAILGTALPTIVGELGGVEHMSWVIAAYILAATIAMPVYGRIGDLTGRKRPFLLAIAVFLVGSAIAGWADSMTWLIAGRFVQGLGGGGLIVTAQAIVADIIPARQRGKYMGVLGGIFAVSSVAGPLLGGYFTDTAGWRWCFWINLPLGVVALVVAARLLDLPRRPLDYRRLDYRGMALMAVAVTCLVLFTSWGGTLYSWGSPTIVGLVVTTVVSGVLFVLAELRASEPVIPLRLFRSRTFTLATAAGLLVGVGMFAGISYVPTFLQMVGGHSAASSGLLMLPLTAGLLLASIVSGQVISATGRYKSFPLVGMAVTALSLALMSTMDAATSDVTIGVYLALLGVGIGLTIQVLVLVVQNAVSHSLVGTATAANNFFREIGAALGTAAVGTLIASRLADRLAGNPAVGDLGSITPDAVRDLPEATRAPIAEAYAAAITPVFGYLVVLFAFGALLVALIPNLPLRTAIESETDLGADARTDTVFEVPQAVAPTETRPSPAAGHTGSRPRTNDDDRSPR